MPLLDNLKDECLVDERLAAIRQGRSSARLGPLDSIRVHQVKRLSASATGPAMTPPSADKLICHNAAGTGRWRSASKDQLDDEPSSTGGEDSKKFLWSFVPLDVVTSYLNERQEAINLNQLMAPTRGHSTDRALSPPLSATNSLDLSDLNKLTLVPTGGSDEPQERRPGLILCREQPLGPGRTNWRPRKSPCAILILAGASGANDEQSAQKSGKLSTTVDSTHC